MAAILSPDVLADEIVVSLARALAAANQQAREAGVDLEQTLITITQQPSQTAPLWKINYGPRDYLGRRGGDLLVEVDARDGSVARILRGQ